MPIFGLLGLLEQRRSWHKTLQILPRKACFGKLSILMVETAIHMLRLVDIAIKLLLLECDFGESKCYSPSSIMKMFQSSLFCLQLQGDSYSRRSAFDPRE
ncbi:hypothetical protein Droror1_Dr00008426 [Drosera rotundifolia]